MRAPRDLLKPSLNARRTTFAFAFAGLTLLLLGGVLGAALAQDPDTVRSVQIPSTFGLPAPHVGDQAAYNETEVAADGTPTATGAERAAFFFEWMPPHEFRDRDGALRTVNEVQIVAHRPDKNGAIVTEKFTYLTDARDGAPVAYGPTKHNSTVPECGPGRTCPTSVDFSFRTTYFSPNPGAYLPCLVKNDLQGLEHSTRTDTELFHNCDIIDHWIESDVPFKAVASERTDGGQDVVYERTAGFLEWVPSQVRVWMRDGIPYPTKLVVEEQNHKGTYLVVRLVGFHRGLNPLATGPGPAASPLPPLDFAPRAPWGMDETGIDHPFPLSQAYQTARSDPNNSTLRDFQNAHPTAYVAAAQYDEWQDPQQGLQRFWSFVVSDGDKSLVTCLSQVTASKARMVTSMLPLADPTNETTVVHRSCTWYNRHPSPAMAPARLPTVASIQTMWRSYASEEYARQEPNAWGFFIGCHDTACTKPNMVFQAGYARSSYRYGSGLPGDSGVSRRFAFSTLDVDAEGKPTHIMEYTYQDTYGAPPKSGVGSDVDASAGLPRIDTGGWIVPFGVYAASVGLAAILVGIAYWIWPSLKGAVGLGLFSRIERPMVLEQPVRAEIAALVEAEPGIHFSEIARRLDLGQGSVTHHLRKLVDTGVLTVQSTDAYTCYFPKGRLDRRVMAAMPHVRAETARQILREAATHPGVNLSELARRLGVARQTVHEHVGRLTAAGLLATEPSGRSLKLSVTSLGTQTMNT